MAIDTSTRFAGVGLEAKGVLWQKSWKSAQNHGVELMPAIQGLLTRAEIAVADLEGIAVAAGPGGFSALRVGISTAKGLAVARGVALIGVSTHDVEAARVWPADGPLVTVIDAGSSGVAWAIYGPSEGDSAGASIMLPADFTTDPAAHGRLGDLAPQAGRVAAGVSRVEDLAASAPAGAIYCGEGTPRLEGIIPEDRIVRIDPPTRRIGDLMALAKAKWGAGETGDPASLQPAYARPPSITKPSR